MKLRYVELPADRIYNRLGIDNLTAWLNIGQHVGAKKWWTEEGINKRNEFARIWIQEFDRITGHFSALEKSISKDGILRPISTISGPARDKFLRTPSPTRPPHFPQDTPLKEVIYTQPFGGSRVTIAQRMGLTVPCAVHDFSNLFPEAPVITSKNFRKWFGNEYTFSGGPPHLRLQRQLHLPRGNYNAMNGHTRNAQRRASQVAKAKLGVK